MNRENQDESFREWLHENIDKVATVTEWARYFGYEDINTFRNVIWNKYEKLPSDILKEARIKKSKKLLENSDKTYREIASEIGLPDGKALFKYFTYHLDTPPSAFREKEY